MKDPSPMSLAKAGVKILPFLTVPGLGGEGLGGVM